MQFSDGNRIDLSFYPLDAIGEATKDSLTVVLVDKDNVLGDVPPSTDGDYLPEEPTAKAYDDCCDEFWWVCPNAAKGLWRQELTYTKTTMEMVIRKPLMNMITWYFGIKTGFRKSPGKRGKYIKDDLEPSLWSKLERTYADSDFENMWDALFTMGDLFRKIGRHVAETYGFAYPEQNDVRATRHLRRVKQLPRNATQIY